MSPFIFLIQLIISWQASVSAQYTAKIPYCKQDVLYPELVLVSTLDGYFTALNAKGKVFWQIETGPGPLLNSNIHKLELNNNGKWVRLIPSLSGSLYKFDGVTIDATPISAETLLTSSFRYSDDLLIAGGQEVRTYGIQLYTGQLLYECLLEGCRNKTDEVDNPSELLVIERKTHTIRAVEPRTGVERWNFSVGQHNIKVPYVDCIDKNYNKYTFNLSSVMPEGLITAHSLKKPSEILWQYKFDVPLVAIWRWNGYELIPWNLFHNGIQNTKISDELASIYLGMHNKQLYVHESAKMKNLLEIKMDSNKKHLSNGKSLAQIPWNPLPASDMIDEVNDETAFSVLHGSEYVNGNGYYLQAIEENTNKSNSKHIIVINKIKSSVLWFWWKELLFLLISTIIVCNIFFYKFIPRYLNALTLSSQVPRIPNSKLVAELHEREKLFGYTNHRSISESSDASGTFVSRYTTEFDHISCLGKGGFGVVFQARKKLDECDYAVKRIRLPNSSIAEQRMMREVKVLAKLDHRSIVRYYNSWLEYPPSEWQRQYDEQWLSDYSMSYTERSPYTTNNSQVNSSVAIKVDDSSDIFNVNIKTINKPCSDSKDDSSSIIFEEDSAAVDLNKSFKTNLSHSTSNKTDSEVTEEEGTDKCFETSAAPGFLYIQMQLCRKDSLKDWLRNKLDRNERCIYIFKQIVEAVDYIHFQGLIHRDLKPSNIFFSLDGQIKVGDFGLVTSINGYDGCSDDESMIGTQKSYTNAVGTHLYMSPEQVNGEQYDFKVDVYSLGIILFELLIPFNTEMERVNTLTDLRKHVYPKNFYLKHENHCKLVKSMLSINPMERPVASDIRSSI